MGQRYTGYLKKPFGKRKKRQKPVVRKGWHLFDPQPDGKRVLLGRFDANGNSSGLLVFLGFLGCLSRFSMLCLTKRLLRQIHVGEVGRYRSGAVRLFVFLWGGEGVLVL